MSFYNFTESERIALCESARAERRTLMDRWERLSASEAEPWNRRAAQAARLLAFASSVADLGCGTMALEHYLRPGTRYVPVDVCERDERTIVHDFNIDPRPPGGAETAACLGLLEYLYDVPGFMVALNRVHQACVVSYCATDAPTPLLPRKAHAWVNEYSKAGIEAIFSEAGWRIDQSEAVDDVQLIWLLQKKHRDERPGENAAPPAASS